MSKNKQLISIFVTCLLTITSTNVVSAKELKIAGGAAPMNNIFKPLKEEFETKTGIILNLFELGPKISMEELLKGKVDTACAGLSWESWSELMKKETGLELKKSDFKIVEIGKDVVMVYVNPANPVKKLSKEQLKAIFTGKIRNWKEVGGNDEPITVVWGTLIPGTNKVFSDNILNGEKVTSEALQVGDANDIKEAISSLPEAIGIGPMSLKEDPSVKTVDTPEVSRPIICATKNAISPELQKLFDFIKDREKRN